MSRGPSSIAQAAEEVQPASAVSTRPAAVSQLVVERLRVTYNHSVIALEEVTFSAGAGEITAIAGSNGAGKTTTLRAASNLLGAVRGQVAGGRVLYEGRNVANLSPAGLVRRGLVQVLEGRHCFPSLTVEENLLTGALARGSTRRERKADLELVYELFPKLRERRLSRAGLTSGGEQQMTAIGRALMSRPRLLLLDEPSMGLAPLTTADIFAALRRLNEEQKLSILIAEQNSALALRYSHRVVVLESGRSVVEGSSAEIRDHHDLEKHYLGAGAFGPQDSSHPTPTDKHIP